jgi:hypothetical protein
MYPITQSFLKNAKEVTSAPTLDEAIFKKCQTRNLSTYIRTKKNNTKHTQDLTLSWFTYAYSQTGIENLLL